MISVQERRHNMLVRFIIKCLKPDEIIVLSEKELKYYKQLSNKCVISSIGVDANKFSSIDSKTKIVLRKKLQLPIDKKIVLHVGHIKEGRNIRSVEKLQSLNYLVVIVGSTTFKSDKALKDELETKGFFFITEYLNNIEEYYQIADLYIFPVEDSKNAIEFPLSVFEAMSCNIPIISTEFGGIKNFIKENDCIKYYKTHKELLKKAQMLSQTTNCNNRQLILEKFTWESVFQSVFNKQL
jgi:glycosyltransferase involved in cell wall biosynthesis